MKSSKQMFIVLVVVLVVLGAYQHGKLQADSAVAPAKIGVINVAEVLENTREHKAWQERMKTEQVAVRQEIETLNNELDALEANLKLRTPGSEDYLTMLEELTQKQARLEAKQKINSIKTEGQMHQWTENLYQKLIKVTEEIAKSKGLDMVIAYEAIDFPTPSLRDFTMALRAKKMIYHNSKYDLTAEVLSAMDNTN